MIYLDTHVVVWLFAGLTEKLSPSGRKLLNQNEILVSPIVLLELQYLRETGKVSAEPEELIVDLSHQIGLRVSDKYFAAAVNQAMTIGWTRDPFDRLIVAQAGLDSSHLLTSDQRILAHFALAQW